MFKSSPAHVSTLTGPTTSGLVSGRLYRNGRRRTDHVVTGFPLPFGHRHWLLEHPVPPRDSAPLTIGLPAGARANLLDHGGFPLSAHPSCGRFGCPLYPETTRCSHGRSRASGRRAPPLPGARSYHPVRFPSPEAEHNEASSRVHSHSPARPSPWPVIPRMEREFLGHAPRASHPTSQEPATHARAGDGHFEHSPGATSPAPPVLQYS